MKAEQRFHLNRLASKLVTQARYGWLDAPWVQVKCPYDNPNCPNPVAPMGAGYHTECVDRMEGRTEVDG